MTLTALKIVSWTGIIIGGLGILGSLMSPADWYGVFGGFLMLSQGVFALAYIKEKENGRN